MKFKTGWSALMTIYDYIVFSYFLLQIIEIDKFYIGLIMIEKKIKKI